MGLFYRDWLPFSGGSIFPATREVPCRTRLEAWWQRPVLSKKERVIIEYERDLEKSLKMKLCT